MVVAKPNNMLGFLKRNCAGLVNRGALLRLYHSLVRSHVCFYSQVWAPQSVVNNLFLVEGIQSRASRFIVGKSSDLSYRDLLIKLRLLPLNYWVEYLDLVFFYKCLVNLADFTIEFDHYFSFVQGRTRRANTAHCLKTNYARTFLFRDYFFDRITIICNNGIPEDIKVAQIHFVLSNANSSLFIVSSLLKMFLMRQCTFLNVVRDPSYYLFPFFLLLTYFGICSM